MGNQKRQLFMPRPPRFTQSVSFPSAFRQLSVSFPSAFRQLSISFPSAFRVTRFRLPVSGPLSSDWIIRKPKSWPDLKTCAAQICLPPFSHFCLSNAIPDRAPVRTFCSPQDVVAFEADDNQDTIAHQQYNRPPFYDFMVPF